MTACTSSGNCYCTQVGLCYPNTISVPVDNCMFMNNLNDPITISYTIINGAGFATNGSDINVCISEYTDNSCINHIHFLFCTLCDLHCKVD